VVTPQTPRQQASYRQNRFPAFPGSTEILLIRHGESEPYVPGTSFPLVDGHGDPELSTEGREQAERVARRLAGAGIDAIYVTRLRRTEQTAAPLAARLAMAPLVETGLREVRLGEWEGGVYRQMVTERHPVAMRAWAEERWDVIPGAERSEEFAARVHAAVERLAAAHPDQRLAVFTHGGVIGQVLKEATGSRPFAFISADNASISRIVVVDGRWIIRGFNDVAHLEGKATREPLV
jgi:probable phosphoglycerate mutase